MAKVSLTNMDVEALLDLRKRVDETLAQRRTDLEKQLKELGGYRDAARVVRGRGSSPLAGRKVAAKYRGPDGETWAGRGAKPRWLVAAMKDTGKRIEEFLIARNSPGQGRTKRR